MGELTEGGLVCHSCWSTERDWDLASRSRKCDGQQPCHRCQLWNIECIFEDRDKESKSQLRQIRDNLLQQAKDVQTVIEVLRSEEYAHQAIQSLWRQEDLSKIATDFENGSWDTGASTPSSKQKGHVSKLLARNHSSASDLDPVDSPRETRPWIPTLDKLSNPDQGKRSGVTRKEGPERAAEIALEMAQSQWDLTVVETGDLQKLLYTFFDAQCFPLFTIDRQLFTDDFMANRNEHCSPALLRAILALACRIEGGYDALESHYVNLGDRMFHESRALLAAGGPSRFSLPNAQAFGLLAIHELARYNQQDTLDLMEEGVIARIACSSINPPNTDGTRRERSALRGPRVEISSLLDISGALDELDDLDIFEETFAQVIDAVYTFSRNSRTKDQKDDRKTLMQTYTTCLEWYSKITGALDFGTLDRSVIIFTHLVYHFCLLNLFRPYCDSTLAETNIDLQEIRNESASAIVALCKTLHDLIPQKRWHCFLALFVYAAGHTMVPTRAMPELTAGDSFESRSTQKSTFSTVPSILFTPSAKSGTLSTGMTTPVAVTDDLTVPSATSDLDAPDGKAPPYALKTFDIGEALSCLGKMKKIFPVARITECWLIEIRGTDGTQEA
ncbi:uncharacterized protein F5Z01DRAFT_674052 [Emericellopsis atlantica]|uniref:Zn(2)-C6 fungal-type domain-containing protein n=1 Tax=Emericellopsis atlantica TaxID=2614577 RepID=A0A9P7ZMB2_9HYPO|nr:uncharacterized protein F5Z01DRAFT_674052 [Emericellopsis atlantica]KAG9254301.1 hypothetical protein F5Z01DRAFT_674052 [Emericellopsis atlantica]